VNGELDQRTQVVAAYSGHEFQAAHFSSIEFRHWMKR
jgi:hypothetical protein